MCRIRNCCFFFELPRGIQLIGGGLSILFTGLLIGTVVRIEDWKSRYINFQAKQVSSRSFNGLSSNLTIDDSFISNSEPGIEYNDAVQNANNGSIKYYNEALSITCIINIIAVIVNGLLIFGVSKKNSYFFIPWQAFFMMTLIFAGLGPIIAVYYVRANIMKDVPWGYFTIPIMFSGLLLYFWLIVLSYAKSLKDIIQVPTNEPRRQLKSSSRPESRTKDEKPMHESYGKGDVEEAFRKEDGDESKESFGNGDGGVVNEDFGNGDGGVVNESVPEPANYTSN